MTGNPDTAATDNVDNTADDKTEVTYEAKVNTLLASVKTNEDGSLQFPDDLDEGLKFAAIAEKRRRDTQAAYTKTTQEAKALKAEKAALLDKFTNVNVELTPEQTEELEELKFSDPDAWRKRLNKYETEARNKRVSEINDELKQVSAGSLEEEELEMRKDMLVSFSAANPDIKIDDDVIANDIPPRLLKKLETGALDFEGFLIACRDYLKTGKVVHTGDDTPSQPNLSKVGGSNQPDKNALNEDMTLSYRKETY